jgi:hypothetical protein
MMTAGMIETAEGYIAYRNEIFTCLSTIVHIMDWDNEWFLASVVNWEVHIKLMKDYVP